MKRLDDPNETQPIIGPHYVKISPDKKNLLVTGYFVQAGDVSFIPRPLPPSLDMAIATSQENKSANNFAQISIVNTPADYKAHWIDILPNGALSFNRTIDFESIFTRDRGGARPHSSVIFDLTDPENPIYY